MKMIDFLTRFLEKGGDITKISYSIDRVGDAAIRSILSFDGETLTVKKPVGKPYIAIRGFVFRNEYKIKAEPRFLRNGLIHLDTPPVLLILTPED